MELQCVNKDRERKRQREIHVNNTFSDKKKLQRRTNKAAAKNGESRLCRVSLRCIFSRIDFMHKRCVCMCVCSISLCMGMCMRYILRIQTHTRMPSERCVHCTLYIELSFTQTSKMFHCTSERSNGRLNKRISLEFIAYFFLPLLVCSKLTDYDICFDDK